MYRYNGFTEIDGVFVPVPGLCHPALAAVADLIRSVDEDYFVVPIPVPISFSSGDDLTLEPVDIPTLAFTRSRVVGSRWDGTDITWDVWIDQYGRAISSTSYAMN